MRGERDIRELLELREKEYTHYMKSSMWKEVSITSKIIEDLEWILDDI